MKKNAFTIIELLGMLAVLGIISLVSFYYISNILKKSKYNEYESFKKNLYLAAETYIEANKELFPELKTLNGTVFIGVQELLNEGYIKKIITNPKTDEYEENATIIAKTNNNYITEYSYNSNDLTINAYDNEGLILHYDGYKKPNNGFWEDLSVNQNHGIIDNSGYSWNIDSIYSNNVNKAIITKDIFNMSEVMTFSVLYKLDVTGPVQPLFSYRKEANSSPMLFNYQVSGIYHLTFDSGNRTNIFSPINADTYYKVDIVVDGLIEKVYINGNLVNTITIHNKLNDISSGLRLSIFGETTKQGHANYYTNGNLYNFKVYAKALTEEQIMKNYEVDKNRFNIGG
ncbi:MAG TPA: hypothetical protein GX747_04525 [Tenericutes bacterium]|nr:hypothetical protein [Mycoplasmatota bacterium]